MRALNRLYFRVFVIILFSSLSFCAHAQVRGVYPLGMSATNSGVTPAPGFSYSNLFLIYSRDLLKDTEGQTIATGSQSVYLDMNSFVWVSKKEILGGARFSASATLPIAKNSLTSEIEGSLSGGAGFGDSYYQPFILGWNKERAGIRLIYGFLAPTGRFDANANDNVGSGYWTHIQAMGTTFYPTNSKSTSFSAFEMYEWHTSQDTTDIHPGDTLNLDYSLTQVIPTNSNLRLQIGFVGYEQWQTTDKTGSGITPEQSAAHYRVHSVGFATNFTFLSPGISLGVKYFNEFSNRSTFEGYSLQFSGSISF